MKKDDDNLKSDKEVTGQVEEIRKKKRSTRNIDPKSGPLSTKERVMEVSRGTMQIDKNQKQRAIQMSDQPLFGLGR